jgi:hypothetical protein
MISMQPGQPTSDEYAPYYDRYIRLVPEGDILDLLARQIAETAASLASFTPAQAQWRPAPGEWNATEIVGHLADSERVFAYRALHFARNDPAPLPGMDQDVFMASADFARRSLADVVAEFVAVRHASLTLLRSLSATTWQRAGVADGNRMSVRALAYVTAGHELHHAADFPRHREMGGTTTAHQ